MGEPFEPKIRAKLTFPPDGLAGACCCATASAPSGPKELPRPADETRLSNLSVSPANRRLEFEPAEGSSVWRCATAPGLLALPQASSDRGHLQADHFELAANLLAGGPLARLGPAGG